MSLSVGKLRHRVRVEQQVQVRNSFGETSVEWEELGTFWAQIRPMSSREMMIAQQIQSKVDTVIVMRFNAAVNASMRGVHVVNGQDGTIYNFSAPIRDPESGLEWMTIPSTSGINVG